MAKDGIDLKVYLQPQIENLNKAKDELGGFVKEFGDEKISQSFNKIQNRISSLGQLLNKDLSFTNFQDAGREVISLLNEMQKITLSMGNLDIIPGFNDLEQKLIGINQQIAQTETAIKKTKEGGKLDKNTGKFSFFAKEKDAQVVSKKFIREEGVKGAGTAGSQIKTYESLIKYQKKAEEQGKTQSETYKEIVKYIQQVEAEEKKRTADLNIQTKTLDKQKELKKETEKQLKELAEKPVDSSEFTEEQKKLIQDINRLYAELIHLKGESTDETKKGKEEQKNFNEANEKTTEDIREQNNEFKKQDGLIGKAVKNFTSYTLILGTMKRALRSGIQTIRVLDNALTEQAMVSGRTKKELQGLLSTYQEIGKSTGATTKEVAEVSTQYFRQGKTIKETKILTEAAVSAAKVGAISTADSVDYLTTAINGFGMAAEDATRVSDRFSALAANSATSYEELAVALSKVAAQAHLAEMSMDFTLGLLAKGIETTREAPETIGTALKTVIARIREMTDYGKTLEDGVSVNNLEEQLKYVGIQLRDTNGELRSSEEVLDEVGRSWDKFSKNQQAALAKAFAGTRQQSRFIAMMQDYDRTLELVAISQKSAGATMAQMSTYTEGLEFALNKVSVAWEGVITSFINSEPIINILDIIGNELEFLNSKAGKPIVWITIASMAAMALASVRKTVIAKVGEFTINQKNLAMQKLEESLEKELLKIDVAKGVLSEEELNNQTELLIKKAKELGLEKEITLEKAKQMATQAAKNKAETVGTTAAAVGGKGLLKTLKGGVKAIPKAGKIAIVAAIATAIGYGIYRGVKHFSKDETVKRESEKLQKLNAQIYKQEQSIAKINQATTAYEHLNEQIIQTEEDQQAVNNSLDAAAEFLTDEQKQQYSVLTSLEEKKNYLDGIKQVQKDNVENARKELMLTIKQSKYQKELLETAEAQAALRYNAMEGVNEESEAYKTVSNIVQKSNASKLAEMEEQEEGSSQRLAQSLEQQLGENFTYKDEEGKKVTRTWEELLTSSTTPLSVQAELYKKLYNKFGSTALGEGIQKEFSVLKQLSDFSEEQLKTLDSKKISLDYVNELQRTLLKAVEGKSNKKVDKELVMRILGAKPEKVKELLLEEFDDLGEEAKKEATLIFQKIQTELIEGPDNTMLALSEAATKIHNKYKKIEESLGEGWSKLSETEKEDFKSNHPELSNIIATEYGDEVGFGDLSKNQIEKVLSIYKKQDKELATLQNKIGKKREALSATITTEDNTVSDEIKKMSREELRSLNELEKGLELIGKGVVQSLEEYINALDELYEAKRNIVQKAKEQEKDALNEQKQAYQEYFDAIDKSMEDCDYFKERDQLTANLSKLSTATDSASLAQKAELENKLKKVEEDRIKKLRDRSREAVIDNIDDKVENIEKILEKISTQQGLKDYLAENKISNEDLFKGIFKDTKLNPLEKIGQANSFIKKLIPNWADIKTGSASDLITMSEDNKSIVINIGGNPVEIPVEDENTINSLWAAIQPILASNGIQ